jgi:hypothetical protein
MRIPRLLLLALLILVCVAPLAAQSSPDKTPAFSQLHLDGLVAPREFRTRAFSSPPLSPNLRTRIRDLQPQPRILPFDPALAQNDNDNDKRCYSIRSYRVTRDDPESDSTRMAGYSECQPAARFQVKAAVDSREQAPR